MGLYFGGRERRRTSKQNGDAGAATPARHNPREVVPMDAPSRIEDGTPIADLIEAREMTDRGLRLAFPMLLDQTEHLPIEDAPVTEVDEELIGRVADKAAEFRDEAFRELRHLDKRAPRRIHIAALATVASLDAFLEAVAEHLRGE